MTNDLNNLNLEEFDNIIGSVKGVVASKIEEMERNQEYLDEVINLLGAMLDSNIKNMEQEKEELGEAYEDDDLLELAKSCRNNTADVPLPIVFK